MFLGIDDFAAGVQKILIGINAGIYHVVSYIYEIFLLLAETNLFTRAEYEELVGKVYTILGVVVLFILAYNILTMIVDPDKDKNFSATGKIVKDVVLTFIYIAICPYLFQFAYEIQASVLNQDIIGGIFSDANSSEPTTSEIDVKNGGRKMASNAFFAFFTASDMSITNDSKGKLYKTDITYDDPDRDDIHLTLDCSSAGKSTCTFELMQKYVDATGSFAPANAFALNIVHDEVEYDWLLALACGCYLVYVIINFCFDLAVRICKLAFYQIIAPLTIACRIIPGQDKIYKNWFNAVKGTYLMVFVRVFVMSLGIYLIRQFESAFTQMGMLNNESGGSLGTGAFAFVFAILGVVTFIKAAPKLVDDIFGFGDLKLGIKEHLKQGGAFAAGSVIGGGVTAGVRNAANAYRMTHEKDPITGKWKRKAGITRGDLVKNGFKGAGSTIAGLTSGMIRSGKDGLKAGSFAEMKKAASTGATAAVDRREKRANYIAAHGGLKGAAKGLVSDFGNSVENYVFDESIEGLTRESNSMGKLLSKYNTFNDTIENLLEKEQQKGGGSVFWGHGFSLAKYGDFDIAAQQLAEIRSKFNRGEASITEVRDAEKAYSDARDAARDELMEIALKGSKGAEYQVLTPKGQAALKDSLVNAESLQATILENANTKVVHDIMGDAALQKIIKNDPANPLKLSDFENGKNKLKDVAKVAQGQAEIKIAEMNKEQAAKGDKK